MTFSEWWEQNKVLYQNLNISKDIAHTIWAAALNNFELKLRTNFSRGHLG